jgi:hypothetical protein
MFSLTPVLSTTNYDTATPSLVCEPGLRLDLKHHNNTLRLLPIDRATIFMPEKYIDLIIKAREGG